MSARRELGRALAAMSLFVACAALPTAASAAEQAPNARGVLPAQGSIRYAVTRGENGLVLGETVHTWHSTGSMYTIESVTRTTGLAALFKHLTIRESSRGRIGAFGLVPLSYRVERNGKVTGSARFDWARHRITYVTDGTQHVAQLAPGSQDILSQLYQAGVQPVTDGRMAMMIATGKKYDSYVFEVVGEETVDLALGKLRTLHLRTPHAPGEHSTELWLALDYHRLPVRLRQIEGDGSLYDSTAVELEYDGVRLPARKTKQR